MDQTDLETYQVQLSQVELALQSDPTSTQLSELRAELKELIDLAQQAIAQSEAAASSKTENRKHSSATPSYIWTAGDECLARYSGDGAWYPARITTIGGSQENRVYNIIFKGYNTTELVKAVDLKPVPINYNQGLPAKRKLTKAEEEEREKKKKKNEKKLEAKAAKAKEQAIKQQSWMKFANKSKKGVHIAGVAGTSIFKTPDNPLGKVGVTGSGKGMTEVASKTKHKFEYREDEA